MRCDQHLTTIEPDKAKAVLLTLSDPTTEPLENATTKGATGSKVRITGRSLRIGCTQQVGHTG